MMDLKLVLVSVCLVMLYSSGSTGDMEVRVLAFMNLVTDVPTMNTYQEIRLLALQQINATVVQVKIPRVGINEPQILYGGNNYSHYMKVDSDLSGPIGHGPDRFGALIVSDNAIAVSASKTAQGSTDSYLSYPVSYNAKRFFIPSFNHIDVGHSQFAMAGLYDDTCVEVWRKENGTFVRVLSTSLSEAEVHLVYSVNQEDFTGYLVNSTRPMAVYGGHECAYVPRSKKFCDHLIEQIPPVEELGTHHHIGPIGGRRLANAGWVIRVLAAHDGTDVEFKTLERTENSVLDAGDYVQYNASDLLLYGRVVCSKPCVVVQYNTGWRSGGETDIQSDPYMTLIPAVNHWKSLMKFGTFTFYHRKAQLDFENYLTVVAPQSSINRVLLDGERFSNAWQNIYDGMAVAYRQIKIGHHTLEESSGVAIMGFLYGHALVEPTGYGQATGYKILNPINKGPWFAQFLNRTPAPGPGGPGTGGLPGGATCSEAPYATTMVDHAPNMTLDLEFRLQPASSPSCYDAHRSWLQSQLVKVNADVTDRICRRLLCANRVEKMGIGSLNLEGTTDSEGRLEFIKVLSNLGSHLDENASVALACKKEVLNYLTNVHTWPATPVTAGCPASGVYVSQASGVARWSCGPR